MKRVALAVVGTVTSLVLLLSFKTHSQGVAATPPAAVSPTGTASPTVTAPSRTGSSTTYTGTAVDTRYGPVQVQITVHNGRVTRATALEYPQGDPRDEQINSYAIPVLDSEAGAAGTASIDMVSGATFTSQGYLSSLQSALDKAGL